ncbi:DUF349 domain-containing protein [Halomonas vilamensis]|uniref:DUF349 domain-containing protein n=1 Tax=Vreelandella vilamensis TaxID=531309 RepID=A0ABU1H0H7_9GAMM|nr:DUF349 domain-containing protein [Halomonas vilamensis]MDR5897817.1 DUF349 domain-containing protein [Halomonas vilamensis]
MHGLLRRLFAPRWQHPDPEVRRQALSRLDPTKPEQHQALETLANDEQADIRLEAFITLDDLDGLIAEYPKQRHDEAWFTAILVRLCGQVGQHDLAERQAKLKALDDSRLLNAVALEGDNLDLRLSALEQLTEEDDLIHQACHNAVVTVRHRAAEQVESEAGLKRLLKESRRDRQVTRLARERLNRLKADAEWGENQHKRREALLKALEQHAKSPWEPLYAGRFRHLQREWEQLEKPPTTEQDARYQQAVLGCRKTLHDHETHEHARQQRQQHQEAAENTREQLLEGLEETLNGLQHGESISDQDIDSLRAQHRLLAQRWQALSDTHLPSEASLERYHRAMQRYEEISAAWERWLAEQPAIKSALHEADEYDADNTALAAHVSACRWPRSLVAPALLQQAQAALNAQKEANTADAPTPDTLEALNQELDAFEHLLERGAFKSASRLHQRIKPQIEALSGKQAKPLISRLKHLGARLAELRDWRGFVAGPKREQLCESIEALADDSQLAEAALDRRHRQLVKEWKSLGDAAANRELSTRFRAASDRIHERLASWRERLTQQRQENLAAREALCEQLEALLEQPSADADPDVLREIRDKARHQWRHYSPVPREHAESIGRRFGRVRHRLQTLIDERAHVIAEQKRELVEHARALVDTSDTPISARTQQAKHLQQQWRQLGRAPKGEEQALWKTFRHACDQVFAQRDAQQSERAAHQQQQLDAMQALIERMDAWQPNSPDDAATLEGFLREAEALEPLPRSRRSDGMQKRLSGIVRARRERLSRLDVMLQVTQWQDILPLVNAHLAADQLALDNPDAVASVDADETLKTPLPDAFIPAHDARNAKRANAATFDSTQQDAIHEELARLRVHLSLLALGRVKQSDEPLRLAIQVERLNEGLQQTRSRAEELEAILTALLALGPMPETLWNAEVGELDDLLSRLSRLPPP